MKVGYASLVNGKKGNRKKGNGNLGHGKNGNGKMGNLTIILTYRQRSISRLTF